MTSQPSSEPGWYPDPSGDGTRYWNGSEWGPLAPPAAAEPARKSRRWRWIGVGGIAAFAIVAGMAENGDGKARTADTPPTRNAQIASSPTSDASDAASLGGARDGQFEFRVLGVERMKSFGGETAQGEFVVVTLHVENTGTDSRSFYGGNQKLIDAAGRQYSVDRAAIFGEPDGDINPGLNKQTHLAFDVVPGTTITALICHDSMFSSGARLLIPNGKHALQ